MKNLVIVTNNIHKIKEIQDLLKDKFSLLTLKDIGFNKEIEETADTIEGNAQIKAKTIFDLYGIECFADDTGLEVEALNNLPGVYSARYAGPSCSYQDNVNKLLTEMKDISNRRARFRTVICLYWLGKPLFFEGVVYGTIANEPLGTNGFGYDSVFIPDGYEKTYGQMSLEEKNSISHRALAVSKLIEFLQTNYNV